MTKVSLRSSMWLSVCEMNAGAEGETAIDMIAIEIEGTEDHTMVEEGIVVMMTTPGVVTMTIDAEMTDTMTIAG